MQVAAFQQQLAKTHTGVVTVTQKRVLDDDARSSTGTKHLDEVLQKQKRRLARLDWEVLLDFLSFFSAKGWIGKAHIKAVLLLNVGQIFRQ